MKEKLYKLVNSKYFTTVFVIFINLCFFIICNVLFEPRFETVDDFTIMKIISKLDGTYSFYSVYIHPVLSFIIMLLYKTGIQINWYTIFLLTLQFISFTIIGIVFINKNKKIGILCYVVIMTTIYSRLLLTINYTSIAAIAILAGIISLIYFLEINNKKYKILGLILITIGTMLRWKSAIISLPFYIIYSIYYFLKNKDFKILINMVIVIVIIIGIILINDIIYKSDVLYDKYNKFNNIRTYFFDSNVLDYNQNKYIFDKTNWTYTDWKLFYTYSFADENFYNIDNLIRLKENIPDNSVIETNKLVYTMKLLLYLSSTKQYMFFSIGIITIILFSFLLNKNRGIILCCFIIHLLVNYMLCYTKPVYRVLISLYTTTMSMMLYIIIDKKYKNMEDKTILIEIKRILILFCAVIYIGFNNILIYETHIGYNKEYFSKVKEVINYTNMNKKNAYVYPNVLTNISLAYSIYEKIPDDTFSNLCHMGDWDIYNKEYYEFKERYQIENIITDLYKKDNLYVISGDVYGADNKVYTDHINSLIEYIKIHYNEDVEYKVIKEFSSSIKIYKLYKI